MKQTNAPKLTPSPSSTKKSKAETEKGPSQVFISMVLDMSWRLAFVVLIPIILGIELDKHYHHVGSLYLIIGFVLAAGGFAVVVYRTYKLANQLASEQLKEIRRAK